MTSYRVTVTYNVDVHDSAALLSAGRAAWTTPSPSWEMAFDEHGAVEVGASVADQVDPGPEASIAFVLGAVLGAQRYPVVPGVRFSGFGVSAVPSPADEGGNVEGGLAPPLA